MIQHIFWHDVYRRHLHAALAAWHQCAAETLWQPAVHVAAGWVTLKVCCEAIAHCNRVMYT